MKKIKFITLLVVSICSVLYFYTNSYSSDSVEKTKYIALTFDDGPHPKETNDVLDVLKKYDAKATFFVAGKHVKWYPKPIIRANKEGHEIGNHTFSHPDISNLTEKEIVKEIKECEDAVYDLIGIKTKIFRPPYGSYNKEKLDLISKEYGYKVILWSSLDARDWENPSADYIASQIINKSKDGDIVLLHDYATNNTVKALEILIPKMKEKGFEFLTVSQLMEIKN